MGALNGNKSVSVRVRELLNDERPVHRRGLSAVILALCRPVSRTDREWQQRHPQLQRQRTRVDGDHDRVRHGNSAIVADISTLVEFKLRSEYRLSSMTGAGACDLWLKPDFVRWLPQRPDR